MKMGHASPHTWCFALMMLAIAVASLEVVEGHKHRMGDKDTYHPTPEDNNRRPPRPHGDNRSDDMRGETSRDRTMDAVTIAIPLVLLALTVLSLVLCACCCKRLQQRSDAAEAVEYQNRVSVISRNQRSWNSEIMRKISVPPVYDDVVEHPGEYIVVDVGNPAPGVSSTATSAARPSFLRSVSGTSGTSQVSLPPSYDVWLAARGASSPSGSTDQLLP